MQYKVVYVITRQPYEIIAKIQESVNHLCELGWIPQGGICIKETNINRVKFHEAFQAMIK